MLGYGVEGKVLEVKEGHDTVLVYGRRGKGCIVNGVEIEVHELTQFKGGGEKGEGRGGEGSKQGERRK